MLNTFLHSIGYSLPDYFALPAEVQEEILNRLPTEDLRELQRVVDALKGDLRVYEDGLSREERRDERDYIRTLEEAIREIERDLGQVDVEENQLTHEVHGDLQISAESTPLDGETYVFNLNPPPDPDAMLEENPDDPLQPPMTAAPVNSLQGVIQNRKVVVDANNDGYLTYADFEYDQMQNDHLPLLNLFLAYGPEVTTSLVAADPSGRSYTFKNEGPEGSNFVTFNGVDPATVALIFNNPTEPSDPQALADLWPPELAQISYPYASRKSFLELARGEVTLAERLAVIPEYTAVKNGLAGSATHTGVPLTGSALSAAQNMVDTFFAFIDSTNPQKNFLNDAWTPAVQDLAGLDDKTRAQVLQAVILSLAQYAPNLLSHMPAEVVSGAEGFLSFDTGDNEDNLSVGSKLTIAVMELHAIGPHGGGQLAIDALFGSGPEPPYMPGLWADRESNRIALNKLKTFDRGTLSTPLDETIKVQDGPFLSAESEDTASLNFPFMYQSTAGGEDNLLKTRNLMFEGAAWGATIGAGMGFLGPPGLLVGVVSGATIGGTVGLAIGGIDYLGGDVLDWW